MGLLFVIAGIYGLTQTRNGYKALNTYSAAQNVTLNYNEDGQLLDRGQPEGAQEILALLENDWGFAVKNRELNPDDPLVNTASEYMYQMATISQHVLHGTQTITLDEDVEYKGETFKAGTYEFDVEGRYWTDFDRQHPLEGPAREQAWSGTAHALVANLGVGAVTASTLLLGLAFSGLVFFLGLGIIVLGLGLVWVSNAVEEEVHHAFEMATDMQQAAPVAG
jgi:hypothetical protein